MNTCLDDFDRQLIALLQEGIPFAERPYGVLGACLGSDEADVLLRMQKLKNAGILQAPKGFFRFAKLGFASALVAMRFGGRSVEKAAEQLRGHPAIKRLCRRDSYYPLWATLVGPRMALADYGGQLERASGAEQIILMPTLKTIKIGGYEIEYSEKEKYFLEPEDEKILKVLEGNFPLTDKPFAQFSETLEINEDVLFEKMNTWKKEGLFQGFIPLLSKNIKERDKEILVAWKVPYENIEDVAERVMETGRARTCAVRSLQEEFPYSLFSTLHGRSLGQCFERLREIDELIGQWPSINLLMLHEYERSNTCFFTADDVFHWEQKILQQS